MSIHFIRWLAWGFLMTLASTFSVEAFQVPLQTLPVTPLEKDPASQTKELWYGELDADVRVFRFLIEVAKAPEGDSTVAHLMSLDEGNARFKLDEFSLDGETLSFQLKATRATYRGNLDKDDKTVTGTWKQGADLKLDFRKVEKPPVDQPKEVWVGNLKAGFQSLEMQLRGYEEKDGRLSYFVDSVSQKAGGFKATLQATDSEFRLDVPALRATYTGSKNAAGTEIVGKWKQLVALDLTWKKADRVLSSTVTARKRPQNPVPPFPYDIREVTFRNELDGVTLSGTLTIPRDSKDAPLAILISGSGPQDRDESLFEHKPFWVIADHLSRHGIAVLRYDDRGVGKSTGAFENATTLDFANDAAAALAFARTLKEIDVRRIGFIGHSEGGLIAPIVASKDPDVAWIVLLAGPGVNGEEILYSQGQLIIAAEGGSVEAQRRQLNLQKLVFQAIKDGVSGDKKDAIIQSIVEELLKGENTATKEERESIDVQIRLNWKEMEKPWFKFFVSHEPGPVLEKVQCAVLALNGSKDTQVDPKLNLPKVDEALKKGGNTHYDVRELPDLNHLFQACKTGGLSEYETIEETIAKSALQSITDWILAQR